MYSKWLADFSSQRPINTLKRTAPASLLVVATLYILCNVAYFAASQYFQTELAFSLTKNGFQYPKSPSRAPSSSSHPFSSQRSSVPRIRPRRSISSSHSVHLEISSPSSSDLLESFESAADRVSSLFLEFGHPHVHSAHPSLRTLSNGV